MSQLKKNIISNFFGNSLVVLLQLAIIPILLRYLGAESYGLIGVYTTLLTLIIFLDFGLSQTITREFAELSVSPANNEVVYKTLKTLELLIFVVAMLMFLVAMFLSAPVSNFWLNNNQLSITLVESCFKWMVIQSAFQLITNFYMSGLQGLQRMVRANFVLVLNHTFRAAAGLCTIIFFHQGIEAYFLSQLILTILGAIITAYSLYSIMPIASHEQSNLLSFKAMYIHFDHVTFLRCKSYALNLALVSFCSFLIVQTDKLILIKIVSLKDFGIYSIVVSLGATIAGGAGLISRAVMPRMTQFVALGETANLKKLYFKTLKIQSWLVLGVASILIITQQYFLTVYLGESNISQQISIVFILLMLGYAVHSLMYIPYSLSLAYGWTNYGVINSVIAFLLMLPLTTILTIKYGIIGAAISWVTIAFLYLIFSLTFLHSKILKGELLKTYKSFGIQLFILFSSFLYSFFKLTTSL